MLVKAKAALRGGCTVCLYLFCQLPGKYTRCVVHIDATFVRSIFQLSLVFRHIFQLFGFDSNSAACAAVQQGLALAFLGYQGTLDFGGSIRTPDGLKKIMVTKEDL